MYQVSTTAGAEAGSCQGCNSCLSTGPEEQTGHSEQEGGWAAFTALCSPCGHHTGQTLVMHCSPRWTQQGGDPLADPSERI